LATDFRTTRSRSYKISEKRPFFLIDVSRGFSYLTGLLNRMTNPAIAAATLLIRCVKKKPPGVRTPRSPLCH
jgi:hypothetical protein